MEQIKVISKKYITKPFKIIHKSCSIHILYHIHHTLTPGTQCKKKFKPLNPSRPEFSKTPFMKAP